jgi:hypothetical protein
LAGWSINDSDSRGKAALANNLDLLPMGLLIEFFFHHVANPDGTGVSRQNGAYLRSSLSNIASGSPLFPRACRQLGLFVLKTAVLRV